MSTRRQRSATAWSLRPWRVMEQEQASCSIWPHGWTQKEKENTEEKKCQYTTCAVCLSHPSITASPALALPYFSYHESPYTHKYRHKVTGLYMACLGTQRIMRQVLISQVSWTDMNNTGYSVTHLPHCCHCQLFLDPPTVGLCNVSVTSLVLA